MATRTLYLIRHGHYEEWTNKEIELEGHLTEIGRRQASLAAERAAELELDRLIHSPLHRAAETCEFIAEKIPWVPVECDPLLVECVPLIPQKWAEYFADYSQEKVERDRAQADAAFEKYFVPAEGGENVREAIVAHGNLIRYLVCRALLVDPDSWGFFYIDFCSLTRVLIKSDGEMRLVFYNHAGHLPQELIATEEKGGLPDTLLAQAAQYEAQGDVELAYHFVNDALAYFYGLENPRVPEAKAHLERLEQMFSSEN